MGDGCWALHLSQSSHSLAQIFCCVFFFFFSPAEKRAVLISRCSVSTHILVTYIVSDAAVVSSTKVAILIPNRLKKLQKIIIGVAEQKIQFLMFRLYISEDNSKRIRVWDRLLRSKWKAERNRTLGRGSINQEKYQDNRNIGQPSLILGGKSSSCLQAEFQQFQLSLYISTPNQEKHHVLYPTTPCFMEGPSLVIHIV